MRQDMDQLSARNRELINDAETRTGWFAAAGLVIVLAGVGLGLLGRRGEKKRSWRESFVPDDGDADASFASTRASLPEVREELHEAKAPPAIPVASYRITTRDTVTDLDITKIDVQESTGHGTIMNTTTAAGTTMFPSDIVGGTTVGASERKTALQSLDFSLDDFDTPMTGERPAPVFAPSKPLTVESEAARASMFEEIEKVHRASKKS